MNRARTLAEFFQVEQVKFGLVKPEEVMRSIALFLIDMQRAYADPDHPKKYGNQYTQQTADHIAELVPVFRDAGFRLYWPYFYYPEEGNDPEKAGGGWYKTRPDENDEVFGKTRASIFYGTTLKNELLNEERVNLLVGGFNTNACIMSTVMDALDLDLRFNICVLSDMTHSGGRGHAYKDNHLMKMQGVGAIIADAAEVLAIAKELPGLYPMV